MVVPRLFGVFAVWLDDDTLQSKEVYLPSLPQQYDPHRLAKVMQRHQVCVGVCVWVWVQTGLAVHSVLLISIMCCFKLYSFGKLLSQNTCII